MKNPINKLMKTPYKYVVIFVIIFLVIFGIGVVAIQMMNNEITQENITYTEFTVVDKYVSEQGDHYYMIISDTNQTFDIRSDDVGSDIYNRLEVGQHYHFVTQKENGAKITHIIQVYNDTN